MWKDEGEIIMGTKNFLLTYLKEYTDGERSFEYEWFESEEDLKDFINQNKENIREINDAIEVCQAREIE